MRAGPLSTARTISILVRMAGRRFLNRLGATFTRRRRSTARAAPERKRTATPGKGRGLLVSGLLALLFLPQGFPLAGKVVDKTILAVARDELPTASGRVRLHRAAYENLTRASWLAGRSSDAAAARHAARQCFVVDLTLRGHYTGPAAVSVPGELAAEERLNEAGKQRLEELCQLWESRGLEAFQPERELPWPEPVIWTSGAQQDRFLGAMGALLAFLWLGVLLGTLGTQNTDLGRVEWSLEWLFTFPLRTRALFLAKLLEQGLVSAFPWFTLFPMCATLYLATGWGWSSFPLGAAVTLCLSFLLAAARLAIETWLRKRVSFPRVKSLQALASIAGMIALYVVIYLGIVQRPPDWYEDFVRGAWSGLCWLPPGLPVLFASQPHAPWLAAGVLVAATIGLGWASVLGTSALVTDGLLRTSGAVHQGSRGPLAARRGRGSLARGIVGKELRLLWRDRSFLVQTLVVPLVIIGFQVLLNPQLLSAGARDYRHGAMTAFGIGAYMLLFGAFRVLSSETAGLWLLCTLPRSLASILREKTRLWAGISSLYVIAMLVLITVQGRQMDAGLASAAVMALVGIGIYAHIAAGLGILATDPVDAHSQRRSRPGLAYLYMLLSSFYGYAIYSPSAWDKAVTVMLCGLLAVAVWQKVEDRIPYLLDPTASPPPGIGLSDAIIAALGFFVLQGAFILWWTLATQGQLGGQPGPAALTIAFVLAGGTVFAFTLYTFWRLKVPRLLETVGLRRAAGAPSSAARAIFLGIAAGLAAATFGAGYLQALEHLPSLAPLRQKALEMSSPFSDGGEPWLVVLAVGAAPLFEEYIFRGLLYRGLRRTYGVTAGLLGSAVLFAVVHPPAAIVPVFGLGLAAAWSFERAGLLAAPIAAHMVYNGAVLALTMLKA